jgi:hypothetical protein
MRLPRTLRERRRRRREKADRTLVAARIAKRGEQSTLSQDAEQLRSESRRNTMIPPEL